MAIITGDRNTPGINARTGQPWADYSGEFRPRAEQFAKFHGVDVAAIRRVDLGLPKPERARQFLAFLEEAGSEKAGPLEAVVVVDHGLHVGFPRFAINLGHCAKIAGYVASTKNPAIVFVGYACSLGSGVLGGEGGFADKMRDALDAAGSVHCKVIGHSTAGPASVNPHCNVYEGSGHGLGGIGGKKLVAEDSPDWPAWNREIHRPGSTLWMRFPFMTREEIAAELAA